MLFEFPYVWNEPVEKHFLLCQYKIGTTRFRIANEYQNTEYHYVKYRPKNRVILSREMDSVGQVSTRSLSVNPKRIYRFQNTRKISLRNQ